MNGPDDLQDGPLPVARREGVLVVSFPAGELDQADTPADRERFLMEAHQQVRALIEKTDRPRLLMDFGNVHFASTGMLALMVELHAAVLSRQGQFRISGLQPMVSNVFTVTKLDRLLKIHATVDEAIHAFT